MRLIEQNAVLPIDDMRWLQVHGIKSYDEIHRRASWYEEGSHSARDVEP
jgi:hypothetical protein